MNMMSTVMLLAAGNDPTIGRFLQSFQETLANYGSLAVAIIGLAMVVVGIYQIAKGLMSGGKGQTNWIMALALLLIGGALALTSGWGMVGNFVKIGNGTLNEMSQGNPDDSGSVQNPFDQGGTEG